MLSKIVPEKSDGSWETAPMFCRRNLKSRSLMLCLSTKISPGHKYAYFIINYTLASANMNLNRKNLDSVQQSYHITMQIEIGLFHVEGCLNMHGQTYVL
jgi:hypothetical protein